jgi:hypothetical protein
MPAMPVRRWYVVFLLTALMLFGIGGLIILPPHPALNPTSVVSATPSKPVTLQASPTSLQAPAQSPSATPTDAIAPGLDDFTHQVNDGQKAVVKELFVQNLMALKVLQQPKDDPGYVAQQDNTATQYYRASLSGTIGLLAHNYLAGKKFFDLSLGQVLSVVYGDGSTEQYRVTEINDFERLTHEDMYSDFIDQSNMKRMNVAEVFARYYQRKHVLTLQTCIDRDGDADWGVRFIVANPIP